MKVIRWISLVLLAIPLVAILWSSVWMIVYVQPERAEIAAGTLNHMFVYENFVHEAGYARLALTLIGLLILIFPYRKGEPWAWAAVCLLVFAYEIPVFLFYAMLHVSTWPIFRNLPEPRSIGLAKYAFLVHSMTTLSVLGLALGMSMFLRRKTT